jgi:hypothetical protein
MSMSDPAETNLGDLVRTAADARRRLEELARRLGDVRRRLGPASDAIRPPSPFAGSEPGAIENLELNFQAVDTDPEQSPR